jgi:hypothetical protein
LSARRSPAVVDLDIPEVVRWAFSEHPQDAVRSPSNASFLTKPTKQRMFAFSNIGILLAETDRRVFDRRRHQRQESTNRIR